MIAHCPYCGEAVEFDERSITSIVASSSVDDLTRFTVDFVTRHFRCRSVDDDE